MSEDHPALPLTADEAEKIAGALKRARDGHRCWLGKFQAMLVCRGRPEAADLRENGHLASPFERWYAQESDSYLKSHPEFARLRERHREMRAMARILAQNAVNGAAISAARYLAFANSVERFNECMGSLLAEAEDFLRHVDPLTGITNRMVMLPRLEEERERAKRTGLACSIAIMDLDHFKKVNDAHGHHAGDMVLQTLARYLLGHLRRYDHFYRYGGEEFVLILPHTTPNKVKRVLDRLRRRLKRQVTRLEDGTKLTISASFGIAALTPGRSVKTALDYADKAMYAAKKAGRNRVRVWQGDVGQGQRGA
ncbi:MAG TPA: diguanylate cyclase [Rhodospirillales bacterium]|jgi:diguanylate cyclase (GGDEF)-like protein|nr:diguanylate cyclase [Rhodospirillales bacterium]